jgi:hypothetical protein
MSANNITQKCQKAARAYLVAEGLEFITDAESQIVCGIWAGELQLTTVICQCKTADATGSWEGNWSAELRIEVRSKTDTDNDPEGDDHFANAGEVFSKFMVSTANSRGLISNEEIAFTCQQLEPMRQGWDIDDNSWISWIELKVECAGSYFDVS